MGNLIKLDDKWLKVLNEEFETEYFQKLKKFLQEEKQSSQIVYPPSSQIFAALNYTPLEKVKIVILGQDPYHGQGQANGLCFSVSEGITPPPSLKNIYKEIESDLGFKPPSHGNLSSWSKHGVLLLNTVLTVRAGMPASHQNIGWETFIDAIISKLNSQRSNLVFLLWGNFARGKKALIDSEKHLILEAAHPSPFSAYNGFFGCKHFSKANDYLKRHQINPVNWEVK